MFQRFKNWLYGAGVAVIAAFGIQIHRPPTIDVVVTASPTPVVIPTETPKQTVTPSPTPFVSLEIKVPKLVLGKITGASTNEVEMIKRSIILANDIMSSECFKNQILKSKFTNTNGLSNQQIFELLAKKPMLANVEIFDGSWKQNYVWKTMGIDQGDGVVYVNRFFLSTDLVLASLIMHEDEGHQNGFHHSSSTDYNSIPYSINRIAEEDCVEFTK